MPQQLTMFGVPANLEYLFNIYHDESGSYVRGGDDRWLCHGVLFVPERKQSEVYTALQKVRQAERYDEEEVHYSSLRGHPTGPKARCARGWLKSYVESLSGFCFYHCLAIDTHSSAFEPERYGEPHHAYNRFALMAIEGAIAWSLKTYQRVALRFYSDAKSRQEGDNFAAYIPTQICKNIAEKRLKKPGAYPEIRLLHPEVTSIDSDPRKIEPGLRVECELTQLVDLMTSSISQALTARSEQEAKLELAEEVARWIEDTRQPPWLQTEQLYRRFSLSCFPDEKGNFYNPSLPVLNRNQPPFV
ncbi:MAG: hypothetical protein H5T33_08140 [Candidatus Methanosuratus sp.]|nr:hypothetical protein [Candidatus Methanosuratincola sp.]